MLLNDFVQDVHVIAGTGSRSFQDLPEEERQRILADLKVYLVTEADRITAEHDGRQTVVMSGGALGWDAWLARAAMDVGLGVVFCIPNKGYGDYYWGKVGRADNFYRMLALGMFTEFTLEEVHKQTGIYYREPWTHERTHSNFMRNQRMVDLADQFVVYQPSSRGTKDCVDRIKRANKPFRVFE